MLKVASLEGSGRVQVGADGSPIDEIVRQGARAMLAAALRAEVAAYIEAHAHQVDEFGRRVVVRNGYAQPREVLTSSGAIEVLAPRVNDKRIEEGTGERRRFSSAILAPWCRKSPKVNEVLPLLYLHGLSSNDFGPALEQFLGSGAGLSGPTITRLTAAWQDEAAAFNARDLSGVDFVYVWADGIHVNIRLERRAAVPAGADRGPRRRHQGAGRPGRWVPGVGRVVGGPAARRETPRDARPGAGGRGRGAGVLVGAGRGVPRDTRPQRCWFHKIANVLSALPKSAHPGAKKALGEIWNAEDKTHARAAVSAFEALYGVKFPKAVAKITDDVEELLAFYDFPAEHWIHLRTTNPIESTFATVRHRTKVTKGPGSKAAGIAMAFKLIEAAQARWRAVNAPHLVALVRAGARFENGKLVERAAASNAAAAPDVEQSAEADQAEEAAA